MTEPNLKRHLRTTQQDIAERVGVSRATVSAVLSGNRFVNPELKARILEAIEDLHYVPDIVARSLKTNRTMTIGLVLPNILSSIWATIVRGAAEEELARHNYFIIVSSFNLSEIQGAESLQLLREKRVDGLIIPSPFFSERFILSLKTLLQLLDFPKSTSISSHFDAVF